ncbi:MAG TPA: hypothetical protein VF550_14555 [Polyangia bacterium]
MRPTSTSWCGRVLLVGLLGALATQVLANGGPTEWTVGSVRGGLVPRQNTTVRLRSEELTIAIDPDGKHYDVAAKYLLSNADPEATVRYGVPLLWADGDAKAPRRAADAVRIKVGESESRCTLIKETVTLDANKYDNMDGTPIGGWCVSRLTIPHGDPIPLQLTYRGDLLFTDEDFSKSAFVSYGPRVLRYAFLPAGHWAGPAERMTVTVDLGRFAGLEQVSAPPGVAKQGDKLTWTFTNVDLKTVPDLELKLNVEPLAYVEELARYRKASKVVLAAKSAKAASGAAAGHAVDGDPTTAWCVDRPSPNLWIEVTERKIDPEFRNCGRQGLLLVSSTAEKSAQIKRVRLEACHGTRRGETPVFVDVPVGRVGARGPWGLILSSDAYSELPMADQQAFVEAWRAVEAQTGKCVRVSIIEVEGSGPACIGELIPIRACG